MAPRKPTARSRRLAPDQAQEFEMKAANGEAYLVPAARPRKRPDWAMALTDREWRFVEEYLIDLKAGPAAARAGIGSNRQSSTTMGSNLRRLPHVAAAIDAALASTCGGSVRARIVEELGALAFHNPRDYFSFNANGMTLADSSKLTDEQMAAVKRVKQTKGKVPSLEIELADKQGALDKLARATGLYKDGTTVNTAVQVVMNPKALGYA